MRRRSCPRACSGFFVGPFFWAAIPSPNSNKNLHKETTKSRQYNGAILESLLGRRAVPFILKASQSRQAISLKGTWVRLRAPVGDPKGRSGRQGLNSRNRFFVWCEWNERARRKTDFRTPAVRNSSSIIYADVFSKAIF